MSMDMAYAKRRLTIIWFSGAGFIAALLLIQSFWTSSETYITDLWSWSLPTVMPTLMLMVGVLVMDVSQSNIKKKTADPFFFRLTKTLSIVYLIVVSLTVLLRPFSSLSPAKLMSMSNYWLAPLQGLTTAALGAFFVKQENK